MRYPKFEANFNVNRQVKISDIVERTGIPASTIRYYERAGLLPKVRRGANGYRQYQDKVVECLEVIRLGQSLGFSLDAIRSIRLLHGEALEHGLAEQLRLRLDEVERQRALLDAQQASLRATLARLETHSAEDACVRTALLLRALRHENDGTAT